MRQPKTWVATFDDARCRIFSFDGNPRRLEEIVEQRREGPRKLEFADSAGRVHERFGARRSSIAPRTDPERKLETAFVTALAVHLAAQAEAGSFERLIVAAGPRALGAFRAAAPKQLAAKVVREVGGDYVNGDAARLQQTLEQ